MIGGDDAVKLIQAALRFKLTKGNRAVTPMPTSTAN
jgi:hypothetical protein